MMSDMRSTALLILQFLYEKCAMAGPGLSREQIKQSLHLADEELDPADIYLLGKSYVTGTRGSSRWLTSDGFEFIVSEMDCMIPTSVTAKLVLQLVAAEGKGRSGADVNKVDVCSLLQLTDEQYQEAVQELADNNLIEDVFNVADLKPYCIAIRATAEGRNTLRRGFKREAALGLPQVKRQAAEVPAAVSNRVFVVHGHDEEALRSAARCVEKLGLKPVILREQPNRGRTVIEKFEDFSDVRFAVVLLTPDDVGGKNENDLKPRARQNVIFELGFFIGKLGRGNVCALYKGNTEIFSDYQGVLWVQMDRHDWPVNLAKEMQAAGLPIDLNGLL